MRWLAWVCVLGVLSWASSLACVSGVSPEGVEQVATDAAEVGQREASVQEPPSPPDQRKVIPEPREKPPTELPTLEEVVADVDGGVVPVPDSIPDINREAPPEVLVEKAPQRVPMFVGIGSGLRNVVSCDGGKTWIKNSFQFWQGEGYDYSHSEWVNHGLMHTGDGFVHVMGWGPKRTGRIWRSEDGVSWKTTLDMWNPTDPHYDKNERESFWSADSGDGMIIVGSGRFVRRSLDRGKTWEKPILVHEKNEPGVKHPRPKFVSVKGKAHWIILGGANQKDAQGDALFNLYHSGDRGATWKLVKTPPQFKWCASGRSVAANGTILMLSSLRADAKTGRPDGALCRSTDGGITWTYLGGAGFFSVRRLLWTGSAFRAYLTNKVYESQDGKSWKEQKSSGLNNFRAMARDPQSGVYVAHASKTNYSSGWFARSTDGLHWTKLPASAYPPEGNGAPVTSIVYGMGWASSACVPSP